MIISWCLHKLIGILLRVQLAKKNTKKDYCHCCDVNVTPPMQSVTLNLKSERGQEIIKQVRIGLLRIKYVYKYDAGPSFSVDYTCTCIYSCEPPLASIIIQLNFHCRKHSRRQSDRFYNQEQIKG